MSKYLGTPGIEPLTPPVAQPDETTTETTAQPTETYAQPTETYAKLAPTTKTELSKQFGVSRTSINNWLAEVQRVIDRCGVRDALSTADGMVTPFAQRELTDYRAMGAQAYEADRLARHGVRSDKNSALALTTSSARLPIPFDWDDELDAIDDVEIVDADIASAESLLMVESLRDESENLNLALASVREQTNKLLQRDRRARLQNIAAMAKRDAVEDLATYHTIYRNEIAKGGLA
jgi:hypothetical protein